MGIRSTGERSTIGEWYAAVLDPEPLVLEYSGLSVLVAGMGS
jgi:hypothetical protein